MGGDGEEEFEGMLDPVDPAYLELPSDGPPNLEPMPELDPGGLVRYGVAWYIPRQLYHS